MLTTPPVAAPAVRRATGTDSRERAGSPEAFESALASLAHRASHAGARPGSAKTPRRDDAAAADDRRDPGAPDPAALAAALAVPVRPVVPTPGAGPALGADARRLTSPAALSTAATTATTQAAATAAGATQAAVTGAAATQAAETEAAAIHPTAAQTAIPQPSGPPQPGNTAQPTDPTQPTSAPQPTATPQAAPTPQPDPTTQPGPATQPGPTLPPVATPPPAAGSVSTIRGHRAPAAPGEPATAAVPGDVPPAPTLGTPAPAGAGNQPPADQDPRRGRSTATATVEVAGLGATAAAPAPATAPAAEVAAPPPAPPAPPAIQVALHILPLRVAADGVHRLTVHLHPADLGPVSVVAEIRDGEVAVQLIGATESGRQALHDALPQLRDELARAGFTNCTLDLRQDAPGQDFRQRTPVDPTDVPAAAPVAAAPAESHPRPAVDRNRLLDLRV